MITLRATQKVLRFLPPSPPEAMAHPTNALGDWYVNRFVVARKPLVICMSEASLLTLILPAKDLKTLPQRLSLLVRHRLERMGIATDLIEGEVAAMQPVRVGPTKDRKAIGSLVEFAWLASAHLEGVRNVSSLADVEDDLAETPCRCSGRFQDVIFPDRDTPRLLAAKWRNALTTYVPNYGQTAH